MTDDTLPDDALWAAHEARYGEPTDTYTWDLVADTVLAVAAPLIAAAERERVAGELRDQAARSTVPGVARRALERAAEMVRAGKGADGA